MRSHPIALINRQAQNDGMELLIAALLVALLGILASVGGADSRDLDPRVQPRSW